MPLPPGCLSAAPKPGVDPVVTLAGSGLAGLITRFLGKRAAPFAAALSYVSQQSATFCANGPPAFYQLTAGDYANLTLESLGIASPDPTVVGKLAQIVQYYFWYDICQCTGAPTPPPTTSVEPPNAPGINDSQGPPPNSPCIDLAKSFNNRDGTYVDPIAGDPRNVQNLTPLFFQSATLVSTQDTILQGTPTIPTLKIPSPLPTSMTAVLSDAVNSSGGCSNPVYARTYSATGAVVRNYVNLHAYLGNGSYTNPVAMTFQTGEDRLALFSELSQICTGGGAQLHVVLNCAGGNAPAQDCCPPDPTTNALLVQIRNLIENLQLSTGAPATSWKDGVRHTALGDRGHFVLGKGAVGVRAELTTIPVTSPPHTGDPTYYYDLGFITPMAIDVPLRGQRLLFNPQSFALPQFTDGVAYTFLNGTRGDLVELLPIT